MAATWRRIGIDAWTLCALPIRSWLRSYGRRSPVNCPRDGMRTFREFTPADGPMATRDAGQKTIVALAEAIPNLIGGSGDLDPSTRTALKGKGDFESPNFTPPEGAPPTQGMVGGPLGYVGRNIHFGIREHGMAAIATGMALHGGILPYAATFFTFSDYMRPSIRLAALSKAHVIYVWTHDSIGLGEDGPTHQPIEHLASLRAIPDMMLLRPADANEAVEAWKIAVAHTGRARGARVHAPEVAHFRSQ